MFVPLAYLITTLPRLLIFTIFFGSCKPLAGIITIIVFGVVYTLGFIGFNMLKYRRLKDCTDGEKKYKENYWRYLVKAYFSGIISPCIVLHPSTKTLFFSSLASFIAHSFLLIYLILGSLYFHESLLINKLLIKPLDNLTVAYAISALLVSSFAFSLILDSYSNQKCCTCIPISEISKDNHTFQMIPVTPMLEKTEEDDQDVILQA